MGNICILFAPTLDNLCIKTSKFIDVIDLRPLTKVYQLSNIPITCLTVFMFPLTVASKKKIH